MYDPEMSKKSRVLGLTIVVCLVSLFSLSVSASAYTHTTIHPRAGLYKGFTHTGRHFSLRVNGRVVYDFRLNDQLLTHVHLTLDHYDQFNYEPMPLRLDGSVTGHEAIIGTFTLSQGHYEHFNVFWHSH